MAERPLLLTSREVRTLYGSHGEVSIARRLSAQPIDVLPCRGELAGRAWLALMELDPTRGMVFRCRYGAVGDRLWVQETWRPCGVPQHDDPLHCVEYAASDYCRSGHLRPLRRSRWQLGTRMPRWASRTLVSVVQIQCVRLAELGGVYGWRIRLRRST